jgi:TRAP-type C4-dicarboxylate transport system permease small subunit
MRPDHRSIQIPTNIVSWIAGAAILAIMLQVVVDVAMREIFSAPIDGTIEIVSFYYMVAVTFLPLAYVSHHEGQIFVELFTRGMRPKSLAFLEGLVGIVCFIFVIWFVRETWFAALISFEEGEMWETSDDLITIWPNRFLLPVGMGLLAIYLLIRLIDDFMVAFGKREPVHWE